MSSRRDFLRDVLRQGGCLALAAGLGLPRELRGLPLTMLPGRGAANLRRYPLPAGDSVNIDYHAQVIVARFQAEAYAFSLACPHQQAAVKWVAKSERFQCTRHDSRYSPTGVHIAGRATRNLDRYAVALDGGELVVDLDHWFRSDQDPTGWNAAAVHVE